MTEPTPDFTLKGIPQSISRATYIAMIESLGIDPQQTTRIELGLKSIRVTLHAKSPNGRDMVSEFETNEIAKHEITIPIVDR